MSPPTKLQKALAAVDENNLPGANGKCPSCDKAGLSILVTLYAALPHQWYRPGESDWVHEAGLYDREHYLSDRPLKSSMYVLRRLRAGWLYVYYPEGATWEMYQSQPDGRLLRMAPDLTKAMGIGDVKCSRFGATPETMLLTIADPTQHATAWIGFSEARWTKKVRAKAAKNPAAFHMAKITPKAVTESTVMANMGPLWLVDRTVLANEVLGFQTRTSGRTLQHEAYTRPPYIGEDKLYDVMVRNNAPYKIKDGIVLALPDDIGIATQLNYYRNCALADIMGNTDGKGKAYSDSERDKMVTAGLIDMTPFGDQMKKIKKHLDTTAYDSYLEKYQRCRSASDDFDNRSADYVSWMQFLPKRKLAGAFDGDDAEMSALLGHCVANLYEGCGLTDAEMDKVLMPQMDLNATDEQQLFWRGAAANQEPMLALLATAVVSKGSEGVKQYIEVSEQIAYLKEVRELETEAAHLNAESAKRLMQTIASRARTMQNRNPKAFRRTFRKMQAVALSAEDEAVILLRARGGPLGFLARLRSINGDKGLSFNTPKTAHNREMPNVSPNAGTKVMTKIPKTGAQLDEYLEVLGRQWPKGKPMPPEFQEIAKLVGSEGAVPENKLIAFEEKPSLKGVKGYGAFSAMLGIMRLLALRHSIAELGVDIGEAANSDLKSAKLIKDISEASVSALGAIQATIEIRYVADQIALKGVKSAKYYQLFASAGRLCFLISLIEGALGANETRELWVTGDKEAGAFKGLSTGASVLSGTAYYAYTRMTASAALRAAAFREAAGASGEIAAELALGAEAGAVGAEASIELPPIAMWMGIVSGALFVGSVGFSFWSEHVKTTVFEKWADRCLLGLHGGATRGDYGPAYGSTKRQLDALLRIFYAIKVEKASAFTWNKSIEIKLPSFGEAAEAAVDITGAKLGMFGMYRLRSDEWPKGAKNLALENRQQHRTGNQVNCHCAIEDEGIVMKFEFDSSVTGVPSAAIRYWPNRAAYKDFVIDARSAEEVAEEEANESDSPQTEHSIAK